MRLYQENALPSTKYQPCINILCSISRDLGLVVKSDMRFQNEKKKGNLRNYFKNLGPHYMSYKVKKVIISSIIILLLRFYTFRTSRHMELMITVYINIISVGV